MGIAGIRLHGLGGELSGFWHVMVRASRRMFLRFEGHHVWGIDY